jgi:hypothetical protein
MGMSYQEDEHELCPFLRHVGKGRSSWPLQCFEPVHDMAREFDEQYGRETVAGKPMTTDTPLERDVLVEQLRYMIDATPDRWGCEHWYAIAEAADHIESQAAELAALRELLQPGTMEARINLLAEFAERELGHSRVRSDPFEATIIDSFAALRAENKRLADGCDAKDELIAAHKELVERYKADAERMRTKNAELTKANAQLFDHGKSMFDEIERNKANAERYRLWNDSLDASIDVARQSQPKDAT